MVGYGGGGNLKGWAATGVSYATARRRYEAGTLPVPVYRLGRLIMVGEPVTDAAVGGGQVARVVMWATGQHLAVSRVVTEVGSAVNGHRKEFLALLRDPAVSTIVVEDRGRFARFGVEYVEAALTAQGRRLLVVDHTEVDDDLVGDVTEILTSLCARLYGRRGAADRAQRAVAVATAAEQR